MPSWQVGNWNQGALLREVVKYSVAEYAKGARHTNGVEFFCNMFKRGFHGTYHKMSHKQLDYYMNKFTGGHNVRDRSTPWIRSGCDTRT